MRRLITLAIFLALVLTGANAPTASAVCHQETSAGLVVVPCVSDDDGSKSGGAGGQQPGPPSSDSRANMPGRETPGAPAGPRVPITQDCLKDPSIDTCASPGGSQQPGRPAAPPVNVPAVSRSAALAMRLPLPDVNLYPDPSINRWNMVAVGNPLWLWTTTSSSQSASTTQQGITIQMEARRGPVLVTWGDGTSLTCTTMSQPPQIPMSSPTASPDCGHTYTSKGDRTITVSTTWTVTWAALGQSGTVTVPRSSSRQVDVGELNALIVKR